MNIVQLEIEGQKNPYIDFEITTQVIDVFTQNYEEDNGNKSIEALFKEFGIPMEPNALFFVWVSILTSDKRAINFKSKNVLRENLSEATCDALAVASKMCGDLQFQLLNPEKCQNS